MNFFKFHFVIVSTKVVWLGIYGCNICIATICVCGIFGDWLVMTEAVVDGLCLCLSFFLFGFWFFFFFCFVFCFFFFRKYFFYKILQCCRLSFLVIFWDLNFLFLEWIFLLKVEFYLEILKTYVLSAFY